MKMLSYSLVIPTCGRPASLRGTLDAIALQTRLPELVVVVDASGDALTGQLVKTSLLPVRYERSSVRSAALQRNQGAACVTSPVVGFLDDDITLLPETGRKIMEVFDADKDERTGGIAARIEEIVRPEPRGLSWWYYRIQAGYCDATYGGRLFGPAINCLPCYSESDGDMIAADWLNSGCVFYRTGIFRREMFPPFEGYSFMEDVHLSARIAKTHRLFFHRHAICHHHDVASASRQNVREIARMRIKHQRLVARDVLNLSGPIFESKFFLHRLFATVSMLRRRDAEWRQEIIGTWS